MHMLLLAYFVVVVYKLIILVWSCDSTTISGHMNYPLQIVWMIISCRSSPQGTRIQLNNVISTNNIAFTAPLNPTGASLIPKEDQVWAGLLLKIQSAETFVPKAIQSTTVISESTDRSTGYLVTVREVIFCEDQRKVRETVTAYDLSRVIFV